MRLPIVLALLPLALAACQQQEKATDPDPETSQPALPVEKSPAPAPAASGTAGIPEAGERVGDEVFDGQAEAAIFPGELPESAEAVFRGEVPPGSLRFPRFRPPPVGVDAAGRIGRLPHIRLDRALEFLIGDHLA